jgi:hypothetical protein
MTGRILSVQMGESVIETLKKLGLLTNDVWKALSKDTSTKAVQSFLHSTFRFKTPEKSFAFTVLRQIYPEIYSQMTTDHTAPIRQSETENNETKYEKELTKDRDEAEEHVADLESQGKDSTLEQNELDAMNARLVEIKQIRLIKTIKALDPSVAIEIPSSLQPTVEYMLDLESVMARLNKVMTMIAGIKYQEPVMHDYTVFTQNLLGSQVSMIQESIKYILDATESIDLTEMLNLPLAEAVDSLEDLSRALDNDHLTQLGQFLEDNSCQY